MASLVAALRVSQLDADQIDKELCEIILNQYKRVLDCLAVSDISKFDAEAKIVIRILFWWWSIRRENCTLGQQMMDMSYLNLENSYNRKTFHFLITIVAPYARERFSELIRVLTNESTSEFIDRKIFDRFDVILEFLNVCHFLWFLNSGGFRSVTERILGMRAVHNTRPMLGEIDFSVMNRELIWHGFADLVLFLLPLMNFRRVWNFFRRKLFPSKKTNEDSFESSMILSKDFVANCVVCREYPIAPCHFGCGHAFCYYCLRANVDENDAFECPQCGCSAKNKKFRFVCAMKTPNRRII